jgi:hypothetical protein
MDVRTIATALAFITALVAGGALGWIQGSSPAQVASATPDTTLPVAPGTTFMPVTALEPAGSSAGDAPARTAPPSYAPYDGEVFAIGDSVLAGAAACLEARGVKVNAEQSRQVSAALEILIKRAGSLPPRVIVHLGTNGGAKPAELDAIMEVLGPERLVLWSTIQLPDDPSRYTYERSTNDAIAALADRYPNVRIFDWESLSRQQPEWLYVEGIHMTPQGCEGYARLVEPQVRAPSPFGNR